MTTSGSFEDRLRALCEEREDLLTLLLEAERLAQERKVFAQRRGNEGYMTIKAALSLAIAVWEVEGERRRAGEM